MSLHKTFESVASSTCSFVFAPVSILLPTLHHPKLIHSHACVHVCACVCMCACPCVHVGVRTLC